MNVNKCQMYTFCLLFSEYYEFIHCSLSTMFYKVEKYNISDAA